MPDTVRVRCWKIAANRAVNPRILRSRHPSIARDCPRMPLAKRLVRVILLHSSQLWFTSFGRLLSLEELYIVLIFEFVVD